MIKNSPYKKTFTRNDNRLHMGFDYKDQILKKTTSNQLWGVSAVLDTFLKNINDTMYNLIESVKQIKVWCNPALNKHENKLN